MSSEWPTVRLGDHIESCLGKMLDAKKNKGAYQPYLGNSNVRWGAFDLTDLAEMKFEANEEARYSLEPGDLVVCEGGEPGRSAIWTGEKGMKIQKALHRIRPKKTINNYYLFYWFLYSSKLGLLEPYFTGTTIKHLTGKAISSLEFPLPPISMQVAAVAVLKILDDRITLLRETNKTLESIAQAIFKSWFVDFDPVRAKMEGRQPEGMDGETAALFPDSFEECDFGLVPKGWHWGNLDDLSNLNPESWTAKKHPDTLNYVDLSNTKENIISGVIALPFEAAPSRARRVLRIGDSIVGTVRPGNKSYAFIGCNLENLTGSTGFAVLRPKKIELAEFIYISVTREPVIEHLTHIADGGAYPAVRPEVITKVKTVLPSDKAVQKFHQIVSPLFESVANNQSRVEALTSTRDTLLPRLMSGQIRLPQEQIENALP